MFYSDSSWIWFRSLFFFSYVFLFPTVAGVWTFVLRIVNCVNDARTFHIELLMFSFYSYKHKFSMLHMLQIGCVCTYLLHNYYYFRIIQYFSVFQFQHSFSNSIHFYFSLQYVFGHERWNFPFSLFPPASLKWDASHENFIAF